MWSTRLISDGGLVRTPDGFELDIRLPWYRSLPLSVVHGIALKLDGVPIEQDRIRLRVNDVAVALDDLEGRTDDWWHILDSGHLVVRHAPLEPDREYAADVTLTFEIPYVAGAVIPSSCVKTLRAA